MNGIIYMDITILKDTKVFTNAMELITEERKEKILRMKNDIPARRSLGAGLLLRIALEQNGFLEQMNNIQLEKHGKPYLPDTDFHFSISHSGSYVVCAYSDVPIGIDLQIIKTDIPRYTKKIFSSNENDFLEKMEAFEKKQMFYRLWSRKESLIKWDGRGLRIPLYEVSFVNDLKMVSALEFEGKILYFDEISVISEGYACCICSERKDRNWNIFKMDVKNLNKLLNL